jgi:ribonuclease D
MPKEKLPEPVLVTQPEQLQRIVESFHQEAILAVDTESNSLFAYREQVCLVQISTCNADYLIDPLVLADLSALAPIFADPGIEKVFHAAEYDILCLKRDYGFVFEHLFDTMVAARVLGREAVGLGTMLESEFSVRLDKRFQRADWGARPLQKELLNYARLDTHFLLGLRQCLKKQLETRGLWSLAQEDFERLRQVASQNGQEAIPGWRRIHGATGLSPQQAAILQELCQYRERMASNMNRPVFKVINDQTLFEIARLAPIELKQLRHVQGMSEGQIRRHGKRLLEAVQQGLNNPPVYPPRQTRPDDQYLARLERLRRWRKTAGQYMGVGSDIILPRDLMLKLAERGPTTIEELDLTMAEVPWRREHFGKQILAVINK